MPIVGECISLYDYVADSENHLSLQAGDIISIYQQEGSGWWSGVKKGTQQFGWFPASYVELVQTPSTTTAANTSTSSPWEKHFTEDGQVYYSNIITGESSWTLPSADSGISTPAVVEESWDAQITAPSQAHNVHSRSDSGFNDVTEEFANISLGKTSRPSRSASVISSTTTINSKLQPQSFPQIAPLSFVDSNPQPYAENNRFGYAENFWSDKGDKSGFDILVFKHRNGKEVCKDIAAFMAERSKIEEIYAKSLMELAKSSLGDLEGGTAKTAWNQLKFDLQTQAQSRLDFAGKLNKEVQAPVMNFKNEQKKMRKNYESTIALDRKTMVIKHAHVQKMHKIYIQRSKEAEIADALVARGQTPTQTKKDFMKLEDNARKERKKTSMAAYDYKTAVDDYEKFRRQWEDDMTGATYEFQQAEEERLEFLKQSLQEYMKVQKEVNAKCKESSEMVESSIEAVSKHIDIEMFVKQHFTGRARPAELKFEQYSFGHF